MKTSKQLLYDNEEQIDTLCAYMQDSHFAWSRIKRYGWALFALATTVTALCYYREMLLLALITGLLAAFSAGYSIMAGLTSARYRNEYQLLLDECYIRRDLLTKIIEKEEGESWKS